MLQSIASVALLVREYDEAIAFFTDRLNFTLVEDTRVGPRKRFVRVAPPGSTGIALLLAQASNREQRSRIGNQTGGRVFMFLHTDDFWRDYEAMQSHKIEFTGEPREETYGTVVVFKDLYGNLWDLIQPRDLRSS